MSNEGTDLPNAFMKSGMCWFKTILSPFSAMVKIRFCLFVSFFFVPFKLQTASLQLCVVCFTRFRVYSFHLSKWTPVRRL